MLNILLLFLSIIGIIFLIGHLLFMKALKNADWYTDLTYQFKSEDCPHQKEVKLAHSDWRMLFSLKRIKSNNGHSNESDRRRFCTERRLTCEECGEKRWFYVSNHKEFASTVTSLRLEYLLRTIVSVFLASTVTVFVLDYFLK